MRGIERVAGDEVGGYRVVRQLGRGGSGAVYLVSDEGGGEAALKLVDTSDAGARVRLAREVAALQALRHPAVPRVLDAELDEVDAFVVFEFIDGPSLATRVASRGPLAPPAVAGLARTLADALAAVHSAGVVHRDVTPANVLLGPSGPVLIDFGLSHRHDDDRVTRLGLVSGTAGYVAPEVVDGAEPTAASDEWALAATLAFAACGHAPFGTGMGALSKTLAGDVRPDVPLTLARVLTAAPQFRPSPAELALALADPEAEADAEAEDVDATAVLGVDAVGRTMVAPASWEEEPGSEEEFTDAQLTDEELEPLERALPRRRLVLASWGIALVALATVVPLIAAAVMLVSTVVARGADSAVRAVWRSRDRRGVEQGGIVAQAFASPWHLGRALILSLPSVLLAAGAAYLVGLCGYLLAGTTGTPEVWRAVALVLAGASAVALLGWGPRGREARRGAHLIASALAPGRGASLVWALAAAAVCVVCVGISFGGNEPLWWPIGTQGP